jgi:hypothetical protein
MMFTVRVHVAFYFFFGIGQDVSRTGTLFEGCGRLEQGEKAKEGANPLAPTAKAP